MDFTYDNVIDENDYTVTVQSDTDVKPMLGVYSAKANSKNVSEANTLTVIFSLVGSNFKWETNGTVSFAFTVLPKALQPNYSKIIALDRAYDGTTDVFFQVEQGALQGYFSGDNAPSLLLEEGTISSPNASEAPYIVQVDTFSVSDTNYTLQSSRLQNVFSVRISKADPCIYVQADSDSLFSTATGLPGLSLLPESTAGSVSWLPVTKQNGVIDFNNYLVGENQAEFPYDFVPSDTVNYKETTGNYSFTVVPQAAVTFHVQFDGKTEYNALEYFDRTGLLVTMTYNDGSVADITSATNILYQSSYCLYGTDTHVTVSYRDNLSVYYTDTIPVIVHKLVLPMPYNAMDYTYNGRQNVFIPANFDSSLMTVEGNSGTLASTYDAVVTLKEQAKSNYVFTDGSYVVHVAWDIKPLAKYALFLDRQTFTYTGETISVTVRNDYNADDAFYELTGDLSATNVGTYAVVISFINDNYVWIETENAEPLRLSWTIRPEKITKPVIYDLPFTYDGTEHTVLTDTNDAYTIRGDLTYLHAGSYEVTATLNDAENFVWDDETTGTVSLPYSVAQIPVKKPTYTPEHTFNGSSQFVRIYDTDTYTVNGTTYATSAGDYTATVKLRNKIDYVWDDDSQDDMPVSWYILQLAIPVPTSGGSIGYTGWEQTALISYDHTYCSATGITGINAGEYVATVRLLDKFNTYWADFTTEDKQFHWEIERALINIPKQPDNAVYNGLLQKANITEHPQYTITNNEQTNVGTYTIVVSLINKFNYVWTDNTVTDKTYTWKICSLTLATGESIETTTTYSLGNALITPYRSGYAFAGWYASADYAGEAITSLDQIDADTVLYAKWTENKSDNKTKPTGNAYKKDSIFSTKAIIGISVAGGALVISLLVILLSIVLKRR